MVSKHDKQITVNDHRLSIIGEAVDSELRLNVIVDDVAIGKITVLRYYTPKYAVKGDEVAIWAGQDLFIVHVKHSRVDSYNLADEIVVVYALPKAWCIQ